MSIDIERPNRQSTSFTLRRETVEMLDRLAQAHDTNRSRILEAMINNFGPTLLKEAATK